MMGNDDYVVRQLWIISLTIISFPDWIPDKSNLTLVRMLLDLVRHLNDSVYNFCFLLSCAGFGL
jgi:hypothetical protein